MSNNVENNELYAPKVSIVIPAYNASNYLAEAIESALAQTYANVEIIVVNDGSKDDGATAEVAARYRGKIRYFEKPNGGSSSALNYGIREMTGEWFSWLSHDDLYYPEKVEKQIALLRKLAAEGERVENQVLFAASDLINAKGGYVRRANYDAALEKSKEIDAMSHSAFLIAEAGGKYNFHGCSGLVHKTVFESVGGFDESMRLLNDVDMWKRIFLGGYKIRFLPETLVMGRMHGKQISASIGFSYHNFEQDAYWNDRLNWLLTAEIPENDRRKALFLFGRSAYQKTRKVEGKAAFAYLRQNSSCVEWVTLSVKKQTVIVKSFFWNFLKATYRKLKI